jgi:hypothetical protein
MRREAESRFSFHFSGAALAGGIGTDLEEGGGNGFFRWGCGWGSAP